MLKYLLQSSSKGPSLLHYIQPTLFYLIAPRNNNLLTTIQTNIKKENLKRLLKSTTPDLLINKAISAKQTNYNFLHYKHKVGDDQFLLIYLTNHTPILTYPKILLQLASNNKNLDLLILLTTKYDLDPSFENNTLIQQSIYNNTPNILTFLITDPRTNPAINNNHAITYALANNYLPLFKKLLIHPKVDPSANNNYLLKYTLLENNLTYKDLLLTSPIVKLTARLDKSLPPEIIKLSQEFTNKIELYIVNNKSIN
jgi:hypothetical protein